MTKKKEPEPAINKVTCQNCIKWPCYFHFLKKDEDAISPDCENYEMIDMPWANFGSPTDVEPTKGF